MSAERTKKEKIYGAPELKVPLPRSVFCPGCHYGIIARVLAEVMAELKIAGQAIGLAGVGCAFAGMPLNLNIDFTSAPHGRAPAMATALKRIHPEAVVFTVQGDGDLGAIGLGCFLNALLRGEKLTTIFLNNANYGTTGGQMAPTTLLGMRTTTTPGGRDARTSGFPLHAAELVASFKGVAYSARVSVHTPTNFRQAKRAVTLAFQKQMEGLGYGFVEFLSACPPNWGLTPLEAVKFLAEKMIAEYPLGEFKNLSAVEYPL